MNEFVVHLDNRPGALARLTEVLGEASINIEALAAWSAETEGIVRLIVDDEARARMVFADAGLRAREHHVLVTTLPDRPGELARLSRQLADARVNIDALYVLRSTPDGLELAIAVDEPDAALPLLPVRGSATS